MFNELSWTIMSIRFAHDFEPWIVHILSSPFTAKRFPIDE